MKLSPIDITIVAVYIVAVIIIGFVMKKQASKNIKSYFLGGNKSPWYMLGIGASIMVKLNWSEDKAGSWKCPYHNGRALMELMKRLS